MNTAYSLTSKNQVTIPKKIREKLHIGSKSGVIFREVGNKVYIEKEPTIEEVQAMNQRLLKQRGIGYVSDADYKTAREKFLRDGGEW